MNEDGCVSSDCEGSYITDETAMEYDGYSEETSSDNEALYFRNRKLLSEANAGRFMVNLAAPAVRPRKKHSRNKREKTFKFARPVRQKKRKLVSPKAGVKKKQEEDLDGLLMDFRAQCSEPSTSKESTDVIDLTQEDLGESFEDPSILCSGSEELNNDYSSDISSTDSSVEYLNGNVALPILSHRSQARTSSLYAVRSILDTPKKLLCSNHPTQVCSNCSFVVDTSKLLDPGDNKCDDCGAWKQTKTATAHLSIQFEEDGSVASVQNVTSVSKKRNYTLVRRHYTCKSSPDLSRHISILSDPFGVSKPYQLVQYRFSGIEHSVSVKPHGNSSKDLRPYKRTCPSTVKDLEKELQQHPPKRAVYKVDQKRGGILNISCVGDLPRNALQASRIRCKVNPSCSSKSNDPLQALVVKFKEQLNDPNHFIQSIRLVPEPAVVLFNKIQLNDLDQFCATADKASVLGVDVTFNLGQFYVTMCSYQNLKVINEQGKHPIMIGPALIHSTKDHSTFNILFQEITSKKPLLATTLQAYGTDGEQALSAAAGDAFPYATHLRCANHLKDNIAAHLHKQLLPESVVKEMLNDIFGTAEEKGLIHASSKEFDDKLKVLQQRWDLLEKGYKGTPVVFKWFTLHVAPIIRENMRLELLQDLEVGGEKYTQNNSESLNALVKRYVNFQKQDVLQFVNDLEECVHEQQNEVNKAVIGLGRWMLSSSHSHCGRSVVDWFGPMSQSCKQQSLSSLHATTSRIPAVSPSTSTAVPCATAEDLTTPNHDSELLLPEPCILLTSVLCKSHVVAMWKKASQLLSEKKVVKAPDSNPKTRWVASDTSSSPHVVTTLKANSRRYVCDKQCVGWKCYNVCAHCIATAEDNGELNDLVEWFVSSKGKDCSLTKAVYHATYKHAGLKKPPRRKYGDAKHIPINQKTDRLALCDISNLVQSDSASMHSKPKTATITNDNDANQLQSTNCSLVRQPFVHNIGNSLDIMTTKPQDIPTPKPAKVGHPQVSIGSASKNVQVAQNVGTVNLTSPSQPCITTAITTPLISLLSQLSVPSLLQSLTTVTSGTPKMYTPKPVTVKSNQPFFLSVLCNRVKKCSGCGMLFHNSTASTPVFVLGHMERDWYPQNGQWNLGKMQNKYYHLQKSCILTRCALYRFPEDLFTLQYGTGSPASIPLSVKQIFIKEFGLEV